MLRMEVFLLWNFSHFFRQYKCEFSYLKRKQNKTKFKKHTLSEIFDFRHIKIMTEAKINKSPMLTLLLLITKQLNMYVYLCVIVGLVHYTMTSIQFQSMSI